MDVQPVPDALERLQCRNMTSGVQRQIALLDIVTANTDVCLAYLDSDFYIVWANHALTSRSGTTLDDIVGRYYFDVFPSDDDIALFSKVRESGEPVTVKGKLYTTLEPKNNLYWNWSLMPVSDIIGDGICYVLSLFEVTATKQFEIRLARLNECLLQFGADPDSNIDSLVALCGDLMGASSALYNRLEGDSLHSLSKWNAPENLKTVDKAEGHICRDVIERASDDVLVFRDLQKSLYAQTDPNVSLYGLQTYVGKAVKCSGEHIGSLCMVYQHDFVPNDEDKKLLSIIASALGVEEERRKAETARKKTEKLYRLITEDTTDVIWTSDLDLSITYVSPSVSRLLGYTLEEVLQKPISGIVTESSMSEAIEIVAREVAADLAQTDLQRSDILEIEMICKDGSTVWTEVRANFIRDENHLPIGLLGVTRDISERKRAEDALAEAYRRERNIADTLQQALVTNVSIDLPELGIFASYKPALDEAEVGGDFYDVFPLNDGKIALVMGDVSGKGLAAAVHTSMAKHMLRAYAHQNPTPKHVIRRLNEALCDYLPDDMFITIFYGVMDPSNCTLTYVSAGHDEPLHYCTEYGCVFSLGVTGRALGVIPESRYAQRTVQLSPEDALLIYTDGVTDARTGDVFLGIEGLMEAFEANWHKDERDITHAILAAASEVASGQFRDDAAVLVIKAKCAEAGQLRTSENQMLSSEP